MIITELTYNRLIGSSEGGHARMAKKDTYLALLRRGIDETTSMTLADAGLKIGDLKKITKENLTTNYGLKTAVAESIISVISAEPSAHGRQRFLSKVLAPRRKKLDKIEEERFKRQQKDILADLEEEIERLKFAKVEKYRADKIVMNRLGKTCELLIKLENNLHDETKDDQKVKIRDQIETRNMEAARDWELLSLEGLPQDIVDFRRLRAPELILHACPHCGDDIDPRSSRNSDDADGWSFICWECGEPFEAPLSALIDERLANGTRIVIVENKPPRSPVPAKPASSSFKTIEQLIQRDLELTGATADAMAEAAKVSTLSAGLMSINDWIDQTLAAKGYIQAQEDREDFILRTGAGATKFNKWMKKAGLYFNKQSGRWTRYEDR